jgi:hypothetical protein
MSRHEEPRCRRRVVLALLLLPLPLVLGGGQASCSFMSGDTEDDEEDKHLKSTPGAPAPT